MEPAVVPVSASSLQQLQAQSAQNAETAQGAVRAAGAAGINLTEHEIRVLLSRKAAESIPWFQSTDCGQHPKFMTPAQRSLMFCQVGASISDNTWNIWLAQVSKACDHAAVDCIRAEAVRRGVLSGEAAQCATRPTEQGGSQAAGAL